MRLGPLRPVLPWYVVCVIIMSPWGVWVTVVLSNSSGTLALQERATSRRIRAAIVAVGRKVSGRYNNDSQMKTRTKHRALIWDAISKHTPVVPCH